MNENSNSIMQFKIQLSATNMGVHAHYKHRSYHVSVIILGECSGLLIRSKDQQSKDYQLMCRSEEIIRAIRHVITDSLHQSLDIKCTKGKIDMLNK